MIWRILILILGLVMAAAAIVFGPKIGIEALEIRIAIAIAVLLPLPIMLLASLLRKRGAKQKLKKASAPAIEAPPEIKAALDAKLKRLEEVLRASKVAGESLHLLSRVMVLGPGGGGKTSAIARSQLELPVATAPEGKSSDFELWVSRQGTLLDVPGRYFDDDDGVARAAWLYLLRILSRSRTPPIDSFLVVIPIDEVLGKPPAAVDALSSRVHRRIHEAIDAFGWSVPVFVLFSRCDRLWGFVESFGVLPSSERTQPLGFLASGEEETPELRAKLDALLDGVRNESHGRLAAIDLSLRPATFVFPEELKEATPSLELFLHRLREQTGVGERIQLGGVYFASSVQAERTLDPAIGRIGAEIGFDAAPPSIRAPHEPLSFFLFDLFARVVLPTVWAARRSKLGRKRERARVGLLVGGCAGVGLLILGLSLLSFFNNRALVKTTAEIAGAASRAHSNPTLDQKQILASLAPVAEQLSRLEKMDDSRPLGYRFGLYSGSTLLQPLRHAFDRPMQGLFVDEVGVELESVLGDQTGSGNIAADYDVLKTYLMLTTDRSKLDVDFASRVLVDVWQRRLDASAAREVELLKVLARAYVDEIGHGGSRWRTPSTKLIADARANLQKRNAEYERIIASVTKDAGRPIDLTQLAGGRVPESLRAAAEVDRLYSLDGWRKVRASFEGKPAGADAWVLGVYPSDSAMAAKARAQYDERFLEAWRRFLRGLSVRPARSLAEASRVLDDLTARPSILETLFRAMKTQMSFPSAEEDQLAQAGSLISGKGNAAKAAGLVSGAAARALSKDNPVRAEFQPLFDLVDPPADPAGQKGAGGLAQILDKLAAVKGAIEKPDPRGDTQALEAAVSSARDTIDSVFRSVPEPLAELVKPLFAEAIRGATAEAETDRFERQGRSFSDRVCAVFQETLAGKYPFSPEASEDALPDSVTAVFGPGGVAWTFFDEALKTDLAIVGDSVVETTGKRPVPKDVLTFYRGAVHVRAMLYPGSANTLSRDFQIRPQGIVVSSGGNVQATGVTLEIGGDRRTYRFGPAENWTFVWPAKVGRARLSLEGAGDPAIESWGDWALFRLIDKGTVKPLAGGWVEVRFPFRQGQAQVPLQIRTSGTVNPLLEYRNLRVSCQRAAGTAQHAKP